MGSGIAESVAVACCRFVVRDIDDRALGAARERIEESLARTVKLGKVSDAGEVLERIELTHLGAMRDRDLMVDATSEDAALNVQILKSLSEIVCDDAILASNTSSIPIAQLATVLCAIAVSLLSLAIPTRRRQAPRSEQSPGSRRRLSTSRSVATWSSQETGHASGRARCGGQETMSGSPLSVPPGCERPVPVRVARAPDDQQKRHSAGARAFGA
jgi:hypothetical protein